MKTIQLLSAFANNHWQGQAVETARRYLMKRSPFLILLFLVAILTVLLLVFPLSSTPTVAHLIYEAPITPTVLNYLPYVAKNWPRANFEKAVTFALPELALDPGANAVILLIAPLLQPPTETQDDLFTKEDGVVIGFLQAERDLPLSDKQIPMLPAAEYWVKVKQGQMVFINTRTGQELATSLAADVREIETRDVVPPQAIVTIKDICYSWHHVQVCSEPSPNRALTEEEKGKIWNEMAVGVERLVDAGLLESSETINVVGTIPDVVGDIAEELQQASALVAPTMEFPSPLGDHPVDGALLGVLDALLPIDVPGYEPIPEGAYAVRAVQRGDNEWEGHFERADGFSIDIPAEFVEVRGQIEEPLAILVGFRFILCFFEC